MDAITGPKLSIQNLLQPRLTIELNRIPVTNKENQTNTMAKNSLNDNQLNKYPVKSTLTAEEVIPLSNSGSGETPRHESDIPDADNLSDIQKIDSQITESDQQPDSPGPAKPTSGNTDPDSPKPDPTRYGDWVKNGRCIDF